MAAPDAPDEKQKQDKLKKKLAIEEEFKKVHPKQATEMWKCPRCRVISKLDNPCKCNFTIDQFDNIEKLLVHDSSQ